MYSVCVCVCVFFGIFLRSLPLAILSTFRLRQCFASFRVVDAVDLDSQTGVPRGRLQA